jgi:hypothetical protein
MPASRIAAHALNGSFDLDLDTFNKDRGRYDKDLFLIKSGPPLAAAVPSAVHDRNISLLHISISTQNIPLKIFPLK